MLPSCFRVVLVMFKGCVASRCALADTMSFDLPSTDMVYVSGLPPGTSEDDLATYFGSIGVIKASHDS
jgi:hypothetical protein